MSSVRDELLLAWQPADPSEARALVKTVQQKAQALNVMLPEPPPEPDNCCGNDCIECVWSGHYGELAFWRDEAVSRWR